MTSAALICVALATVTMSLNMLALRRRLEREHKISAAKIYGLQAQIDTLRAEKRKEFHPGGRIGPPAELYARPGAPDPERDTSVAYQSVLCERIGCDGSPCSRCGKESVTFMHIETGAITWNKYLSHDG